MERGALPASKVERGCHLAYTIGVDFGTLSGRAVLVHVETGEELASAVKEYRHAVIDTVLPKRVISCRGTGRCRIRLITLKSWKQPFRLYSNRRTLNRKTLSGSVLILRHVRSCQLTVQGSRYACCRNMKRSRTAM